MPNHHSTFSIASTRQKTSVTSGAIAGIKHRLPHILALQELSPDQAYEFAQLEGYEPMFLSSTPSEVEAGAIAGRDDIHEWRGKNVGTALTGFIFRPDVLTLLRCGRFWLNENPDALPAYTDRGETDKGFGNMNTYRAVLYACLKHVQSGREVYVFNSHYPLKLTPDGSQMRFKCAEAEANKIREIIGGEPRDCVGDKLCVSMGDRNPIPQGVMLPVDASHVEDAASMKPLSDAMHDVRKVHQYGPATTFPGFTYDRAQNPFNEDLTDFVSSEALDMMFANQLPERSGNVVTEFCPESGCITFNPTRFNPGRYLASDHAMQEADFVMADATDA